MFNKKHSNYFEALAESMMEIVNEDERNDTKGHLKMYYDFRLNYGNDDMNIL